MNTDGPMILSVVGAYVVIVVVVVVEGEKKIYFNHEPLEKSENVF